MNSKINIFPIMKKEFPSIRMRIRSPKTFDKSFAYKSVNLENGVRALIGIQKGQDNLKVQTLLFNTNSNINNKVWSLRKAKKWFKENKKNIRTKVFLKDMIDVIKKPAPILLNKNQLEKAVRKLQDHFDRFPRRILNYRGG